MFFNKFIKFIFLTFFFCFLFITLNVAEAKECAEACPPNTICDPNTGTCVAGTGYGLGEAAGIAGLGKPSLPSLIGRFVQGTLSFVGVIFLILMVYGGFLWMTAGGNEEHVAKAKKLIMSATIGLFIVIGAYAITYYLTSVLLEAAKVE